MPEETVDEMSPEDTQKHAEWDRRCKLYRTVHDAYEITQICIERPRVLLYDALIEMLCDAEHILARCRKDLVR